MKFDLNKYGTAVDLVLKAVEDRDPSLDDLHEVIAGILEQTYRILIDVTRALPQELSDAALREEFVEALFDEYTRTHSVKLKKGVGLVERGHKPWLKQEILSGNLVFNSYNDYRNRLQGKMSPDSLVAMDTITSDILDYMGNPRVPYAFKTYGLLLGDVQAGKTSTYTGVCHKAADAGYRIFVVLTGTKSSLRTQTQNRLNADLVGETTNSRGLRDNKNSSRHFSWRTITTTEHDFTKGKVDSQIRPNDPKELYLIVTKKETHVLENILTWLRNVESLDVCRLPMLLIDDEADNASINSNSEEKDPTKINFKIRQFLDYFEKAAYLAVTATPFANVFIDPQINPKTGEIDQDLPDLFPRDYIYSVPPPEGYLGVDKLFGELAEIGNERPKYTTLIPMYPSDESDSLDSKVVAGKWKSGDVLEELPVSLRRAVLYFLCVCTYKDLCDKVKSNTSMFVHIFRYRSLQRKLKELIKDFVMEVSAFAEAESKRNMPETRSNSIYRELEELWNNGCQQELWYEDPTAGDKPKTMKQLSGYDWEAVWRKRFGKTVKTVSTVEINMNSKVKNLDAYYEGHDARLIAVGGDALSRGLTLEGLCVSYFSRRSFAYDTLLQMGRWFGYRGPMLNYMKIWISDCLIDAYGYISEALCEFRETVETMLRQKRSPKDFGLRIRRAPKQVRLMITAQNKRRTAKRIRAAVQYGGRVFQSSTMPLSPEERKENVELVSKWLCVLGPYQKGNEAFPEIGTGGGADDLVWRNVPSEMVGKLLMDFSVPCWSDDIEIGPVAKQIMQRNEHWTVRVISVEEGEGYAKEKIFQLPGDSAVRCSRRTMISRSHWIQPNNRGVLSQAHFSRHLSAEQKAEIRRRRNCEFLSPGVVLSEDGEQPQLLIYPIRPLSEDKASKNLHGQFYGVDQPIVALCFGVPNSRDGHSDLVFVEYETNKIYQMQTDSHVDVTYGDD